MDSVASQPQPLNIFISHKTKDKAAAQLLKDLLTRHCTGITVFLSSDAQSLTGGNLWWPTIHNALDAADWLLLIYTTPYDNWDWCVYEAGYFAGRRTAEKTETLLVLHPPEVQRPAPLAPWQSLPAERGPILGLFRKIFRPGNPRCHWSGSAEDMEKVATAIADAIAPLKMEALYPNHRLTVVVPRQTPAARAADVPGLPDDAYVELEAATAELLKLKQRPRHSWPHFREAARSFKFDIETLARVVALAATPHAFPSSLSLFRAPRDGCGYRPLIYRVTTEDAGGVRVELVLMALPENMDPDDSEAFERVHRLLWLAKQFRRRVVEKYASQLPSIDQENSSEKKTLFLKAVLYDVDVMGDQVMNQGFRGDDWLFDSFDDTRRRKVQELIAEWRVVKQRLETSVAHGGCDRPSEILNSMRFINLGFLKLAVSRLDEIVRTFTFPDPGQSDPSRQDRETETLPGRNDPSAANGGNPAAPPRQHPGTDGKAVGQARAPQISRSLSKRVVE